jgi:uncharacterized membrane protein
MNPVLNEWIQLLLRWVHVFAGILWVGTTYYFAWLDGRFSELEAAAKDSGARASSGVAENYVWMVHSGGFYLVEKQKSPQAIPGKLHWFRWEAVITWLSGLLLFSLIYYHGGQIVDFEGARLSATTAMFLSLGLLIAGWLCYDVLWSSKLFTNEMLGVVISYLLIVATIYGLFHWFSSRAAPMQLGAMFGTIMTANVWMRILPAQRRMVRALNEGRQPDLTEGLRAKTRSKHNTFLVVPVVFTMISNHYPTLTYGSRYNWEILSGLVLAGWGAAKLLRRA